MKKELLPIIFLAGILAISCKNDHDSPELSPIDTSKVKIISDVTSNPAAGSWMTTTGEVTIRLSDVRMTAPKGVVLRSVDLIANGQGIMQKPFSGETLEFKVSLDSYITKGRVNFALYGNLIQKDSRDAQIIIADNIQHIVFAEMPEFDCMVTLDINVKGRSSTGEELDRTFQVSSLDHFTIAVPQSEIYWTPASGTASTLDLTITASAHASSVNSTLEATVSRLQWNKTDKSSPVIKMEIDNTPGSLNSAKLGLNVSTVRHGTWEGVTVKEQNCEYFYEVKES